jgi:hypothetical protein
MSFIPNDAKLIVENISSASPVFSSRGSRKGAHVEKAFRFEFIDGANVRHISIARSTDLGVTVYVNRFSIKGIDFLASDCDQNNKTKFYPTGYVGKTGRAGLSTAAAGLSSLNPEKNDVLRLSVANEIDFIKLLNWYVAGNLLKSTSKAAQVAPNSKVNATLTKPENVGQKNQFFDHIDGEKNGNGNAIVDLQNSIALVAKNVEAEYSNTPGAEVDAIVKRRIGQSNFRALLALHVGMSCYVTGLDKSRLLIASHIVPWSKSSPEEKTDPENGLLLAVNWDAVFDKGFIYFSDDGQVVFSEVLDVESTNCLGLDRNARLSCALLTERRKAYLLRHRETCFESWTKPST